MNVMRSKWNTYAQNLGQNSYEKPILNTIQVWGQNDLYANKLSYVGIFQNNLSN